jgi:hypothetical protein
MFKIEETPTFSAQITVRPPGSDEQNFNATFNAMGVSQFSEFDLATPEGAESFLREALIECDGIVGADDEPVAWGGEVLDGLMDLPWVRGPLIRAYLKGINEAALGN